MNLGIEGKVAMVAAGTKGIGLASARALMDEGCRVSVCGRGADALAAAAAVGLDTFAADVTKKADLESWFNHVVGMLGVPQIVVTNSGGPPAGSWQGLTDEQWESGVQSTLMNVVRTARLVTPGMIELGWGRLIHISSLVAKQPLLLLPISSTLRAGLMSLTRLQATELAEHGITVNGVLPGHTLTDRQRELAEHRAKRDHITPAQALEIQAKEVPMRRIGEPEEIAAAVLFLASKQASYITGTNLLVDGGLVLGAV